MYYPVLDKNNVLIPLRQICNDKGSKYDNNQIQSRWAALIGFDLIATLSVQNSNYARVSKFNKVNFLNGKSILIHLIHFYII